MSNTPLQSRVHKSLGLEAAKEKRGEDRSREEKGSGRRGETCDMPLIACLHFLIRLT